MSDQVQTAGPEITGPMYRPSRDEEAGIDAGTKRILYMMGAGGFAILVAIAGYSLVGHSGGGVVPVIQADQNPLRVKPVNPGGMAVGPEAKQADPNDSHLAPGTEAPNPRALLAITGQGKSPAGPSVTMHAKTVTVQLSEAKSEAQAQLLWEKLAKKQPDLFGQHRALFQKVTDRGAAPWRLRSGGFADPAQAKAFCDKVKAKGGQCSVIES
jgi:hypothetical protein